MESKNDGDVKLVLQELLNEIKPLSEHRATMMLDEEREVMISDIQKTAASSNSK